MVSAVVVVVGSFACLMLIILSVTIGFSFFVVPILIAEVMLLAAVYVMRRAFAPKDVEPEPRAAWYARQGDAPPRATERADERHPGLDRSANRRRRRVE
jgi:hypothetical protein